MATLKTDDDGKAYNEIPMDGCDLGYIRNLNILGDTERGFYANSNRSEKTSWLSAWYYTYPVTWLMQCDLCGKISTPKKIQYRSEVSDWNLPRTIMNRIDFKNPLSRAEGKSELCMSCYNKLKPIERAADEVRENHLLINKLKLEIRKWLKSQTQDS